MRTDEDVKTDIVNSMRRDTRVDASDVTVEIDDGVVTLSGTVPNYRSMWAAYDDALLTDGVRRVVSVLKVIFQPTYEAPTDDDIAQWARQIFRWNANIDAANIEVEVQDGKVKLTGTVPWYWQQEAAEEIVSQLRGVKEVENELAIVPTEKISDEVIAEDIMAEMERSILVDPSQVEVTVADGVVTLTGEVNTTFPSMRAERIAKNALGVKDVHNLLTVKYI